MASKFLQRLIERDGPIVVVDLEATCARDDTVPKKEMETIEIGAVAVDSALTPCAEFQAFVRPVRHPRLTEFCRELTTITQAEVDAAERLPAVARSFGDWIMATGATAWASWGMFDRMLFDRDFRYHGVPSPLPGCHINVRDCFEATVSTRPNDFADALAAVGLAFDGQPHRGIDDARNIARLLPRIAAAASR